MQCQQCQSAHVKPFGLWGTKEPRQRYCCLDCGATFAEGIIGSLPGHFCKGTKLLKLLWAFEQGWSTRAASRHAHCSINTACKIADILQRNQRCQCGQKATHNGWCSWRYANSPKRQTVFAVVAPLGRIASRINRQGRPSHVRSLPMVWPFISGEPSDEHALLMAVNRTVPRGIPEQIRQDICQDVIVEVLSGRTLSAELIASVIRTGRKRYRCRWDEVSLASPCGTSAFRTWNDVLSVNHPKTLFRPRTHPRGKSYQTPIKSEQFSPPPPKRTHRPQHELRGENSPASKLTFDQVVAMRHMYRSGRHSQAQLGKLFRVTQATVFLILTGGTWKDAPGPIYIPQKDLDAWGLLGMEPPLLSQRKQKLTTQGHLEYRRAPEALCSAPQSTAHKGSQDSTGTFSSPTRYRREGAGIAGPIPAEPTTAEGIWEKSPGVSRSKDLMEISLQQDFSEFWTQYPRRVGKLDAMRAYEKARSLASAAEILDGLKNYCANLPSEIRYVAHPATWLNSGRWMDEYTASSKPNSRAAEQFPRRIEQLNDSGEDWFAECQRLHSGNCGGRVAHDTQMWIEKQKKASA